MRLQLKLRPPELPLSIVIHPLSVPSQGSRKQPLRFIEAALAFCPGSRQKVYTPPLFPYCARPVPTVDGRIWLNVLVSVYRDSPLFTSSASVLNRSADP